MRICVAGAVGLIVGLTALVRATIPSPGPLSSVHRHEADLDGLFGCLGCHGGSDEPMATACLECHEDIDAQVHRGARGFHANITTVPVGHCDACHREHRSEYEALVGDHSFAIAGFEGRDGYGHQGLDFHLEGRHLTLECGACHENAPVAHLEKGQKRFLGENQLCTSCHEDPHKGKLDDCARCHGQEEKFELAPCFEHAAAFPLVGGHERVRCVDCHEKGSPHAFEALALAAERDGLDPASIRPCGQCHQAPHSDGFLGSVAAGLSERRDETCDECHAVRHAGFGGHDATMTAELHARAGFALEKPHAGLECRQCHEGFAELAALESEDARRDGYRKAYPGRAPEACAACHGDPHEGQFAGGQYERAACLDCHDPHAFAPAAFDAAAHERTRFPLLGKHLRTECGKCHERPEGAEEGTPPVLTGTATACAECHEHPHEGQFEVGAFAGRNCETCHDQEAYAPARFDLTLHERSSFPLLGAHRAVACGSCHEPIDGDEHKRRFTGTTSVCADCHEDAHAGAFDRAGLPREVAGHTGCARCHFGAEAFRPVQKEQFDHGVWTRFPLRGKHGEADCAKCHLEQRSADGKRTRTVPGTDCTSCHEDRHAGQFVRDGKVDCRRCHVDDKTFTDLVFDHQKDSRYPLDEDHRELACSACHKAVDLPGGGTLVRYKPLGVECKDCHGAFVPKARVKKPERNYIWRVNR